MKKINIYGIPFDNVTMAEAVALAEDELQKKGTSVVVTPNAEIAEMCIEDETVNQIILSAEIILPDGAGIITAAEILGTPLKEKVAGVEFGMELIRHAEKHGYSLFFLGGKPSVAETAAERLKETYKNLKIAGTYDGYFEKTGAENDAVIAEINASGADILFVCLGAPKQEIFMQNHCGDLNVKMMIGLGGTLDSFAGTVKRAPRWMIRLNLEWLYRIACEPSRFKRFYDSNVKFIFKIKAMQKDKRA